MCSDFTLNHLANHLAEGEVGMYQCFVVLVRRCEYGWERLKSPLSGLNITTPPWDDHGNPTKRVESKQRVSLWDQLEQFNSFDRRQVMKIGIAICFERGITLTAGEFQGNKKQHKSENKIYAIV
jgi:hypothetical protein